MKLLVAFALVFSFGLSMDTFAKGPKPGDSVKPSTGGKPGDGSSGGKVPSIDPATGKPRVDAAGKPVYVTPEEAFREAGTRLHGTGGTPANGSNNQAPVPPPTRPLVNNVPQLIKPRTGGVTPPESMPAFVPRKMSKRKASPDYQNRPFESVGTENDEIVKAAIERMKDSEEETELANLEIELTDAVRAQIEIAARAQINGKQADPKNLSQKVTDAAAAIRKNRAKILEAAKQSGLSENDPAVKNLLKNMIAVYSGIPFHSPKAGAGSAEAGIETFMKNIGNLDGKRLLGMAKWFDAYGDAYRTARSGHPPMSIAEAHKEAAKARDRFVTERANAKSMDPTKLVGTLCKCNSCDG